MLVLVLALGWLGFASGATPAADATGAALSYVQTNKNKLGVTGADLREIAVSNTVVSRHNGVTHVYLQQRHRGIDVWNAPAAPSSRISPASLQARMPARAVSRPRRLPLVV